MIVGMFAFAMWREKLRKDMAAVFTSRPDFEPSQHIASVDATTALAVDVSRKQLCLLRRNASGELTPQIAPYSSVLACEIFEDGTAIMKTDRGSQVAGAVVGGVLPRGRRSPCRRPHGKARGCRARSNESKCN